MRSTPHTCSSTAIVGLKYRVNPVIARSGGLHPSQTHTHSTHTNSKHTHLQQHRNRGPEVAREPRNRKIRQQRERRRQQHGGEPEARVVEELRCNTCVCECVSVCDCVCMRVRTCLET